MRLNRNSPGKHLVECQIRIRGHLPETWSAWLGELDIRDEPDGVGLLTGWLPDQSALFGVFERLRDAGIEMVSIHCTLRPQSLPEKQQVIEG